MNPVAPVAPPRPAPAAPETSATEADQFLDRALITTFLEYVPYAVYFKDLDSRFIAVSESTARKHGMKAADMVGKLDADFFVSEFATGYRAVEERIMTTGEPILGKVDCEVWPDGRKSWSLSSKMPLRDKAGRIIGLIGLGRDITEEKLLELALEKSQRDLVDASRQAGMTEVANGVLHNVGNVLNSLNISAALIATGLRQAKGESLARVAALLREHEADLEKFLGCDPKGMRVAELVASLAQYEVEEQARLLRETEALQKNIDHIKEIVSMQQAYATMVGVVEPMDAAGLLEDAVRMNKSTLARRDVQLRREFTAAPPVLAERGKTLQILINLIRNAKYACDDSQREEKVITLRIVPTPAGRVQLIVQDNGIGIPAENMTRIFNHGFTTRSNGHGFGLHSSANAARELQGSLTAHSDGPGTGAMFILELPASADGSPSTP